MYAGKYKPDLELRKPYKTQQVALTGDPGSGLTIDDGVLQIGKTRPTARWIPFGASTSNIQTDRTTGLMWVKAPSLIIPGGTGLVKPTGRGVYDNVSTTYAQYDLVTYGGTTWMALQAVAAAQGNPSEGANWTASAWAITATAGAGTVQTSKTVMWDVHGTPYTFPIFTACTVLNTATYGGFNDWRVPNIEELQSIHRWMSTETPKFCIHSADGFGFVAADVFLWSSTTSMDDATVTAFGLRLVTGAMQVIPKTDTAGCCWLPVRGPVF